MMKKFLTVAVLTLAFVTVGGKAQAEPLTSIPHTSLIDELKPEQKPKPQIKKYVVTSGDTLNSISKKHNISVQRLFDKNNSIKDPNTIITGQVILIPNKDEKLKQRKLTSAELPLGSSTDGLKGTLGFASPYGNCVNELGVNNPFDGTNPISWAVLTLTPSIGATALWTYNHTGVVVGIWSNGDLELRHQNFPGGQHRFARSEFRGFR